MPGEGRHALILDDEATALGGIALQLIRLGIDCFYAKDPDEASLLAMQPEASAVRALIFPDTSNALVAGLADRLRRRLGEQPLGLVAVGAVEDDEIRTALRKLGVSWALRPPFDESTLRWVVNAAMCPFRHGGRREHQRVPAALLALAFVGERRKDLLLSTLSVGGAFLETPLPFPIGTRVRLELPLPEGVVEATGLVGNRQEASDAGRQGFPSGMGVVFESLAPAARDAIERFVRERERHFSV